MLAPTSAKSAMHVNHSRSVLGVAGTALIALGSTALHAQTPVCAPPGCNSVASDGFQNTGVGTGALANAVESEDPRVLTAQANTAVGDGALGFLTTGGSNVAVGLLALAKTTTGTDNTALGVQSLFSNTEAREMLL